MDKQVCKIFEGLNLKKNAQGSLLVAVIREILGKIKFYFSKIMSILFQKHQNAIILKL